MLSRPVTSHYSSAYTNLLVVVCGCQLMCCDCWWWL